MAAENERLPKRRRISHSEPTTYTNAVIENVADLHNLLRFRQSSSTEVKQGIHQFKSFLTTATKDENVSTQSQNLRILKQYCDDQSLANGKQSDFPDLISAWSFAAEVNNDAVAAAVVAVLAQFLRTISTYLEFREFGLSLCKTLLQRDQVRLIARSLSQPKAKEHLISPCLRLLTEITSFDGGAFAGSLYSRRDNLFKNLDGFLDQIFFQENMPMEDRRGPSLRRMAQRYVLSLLKFLSSKAKTDLISQGRILHAFVRGIRYDGDDIIFDILRTIESAIVQDESVDRAYKSRFLNQRNLTSLISLYNYDETQDPPALKSVRERAHEFLMNTFSIVENGVLLPQTGWYPTGRHLEAHGISSKDSSTIDLGLDSLTYSDSYQQGVLVKNGTLSALIQNLKPERDVLQSALILRMFELAPELLAEYFSKKTRFIVEPKDDSIWLNQSAFLYSVIKLPIPPFCGWKDKLPARPPPNSIVIESILPRPLDSATLKKCLSINNEVLTLFAARVMTVALEKLENVLNLFGEEKLKSSLWVQASARLKELFVERAIPIKDLVAAFQHAPKEKVALKASISEALATYFRVIPEVALSEKFDIAVPMAEIVQRIEDVSEDGAKNLLMEQLSNLAVIANVSQITNWWLKPKTLQLSPFISLLRISVTSQSAVSVITKLEGVIRNVMFEKGVLESDDKAFRALIASLSSTKSRTTGATVFTFVDNCMTRVIQQPVSYQDQLVVAQRLVSDERPLSLLACSVAEQWPFLAKKTDSKAQKDIAAWISCFFAALDQAGENFRVMSHFQDVMIEATNEYAAKILQKSIDKQPKIPLFLEAIRTTHSKQQSKADCSSSIAQVAHIDIEDFLSPPTVIPQSILGLDKWQSADIEAYIQSSRIPNLIQCLSSSSTELRLQALHTLPSLIHALELSSYTEKSSIYLLLGELSATVNAHRISESPLTSTVAEVAILLFRILSDPSDKMYRKANKFLNKGPSWDATKLLPYWIDKILLREPEDDDGFYAEVDRLLDVLQNALRSEQDMELFRQGNVFEHILAFYANPHCQKTAKRKILGTVWRAVRYGGGGAAMTLVTRVGIRAWMDIRTRIARDDEERAILLALKDEVDKNCNLEEVERWCFSTRASTAVDVVGLL